MHLPNGPHGYGLVTKSLHWMTVAAITAQFVVGYAMDDEDEVADVDCDPPGEERSGGDTSDAQEERLDRIEELCEQRQDAREDAAENPVDSAFGELGDGGLFNGGSPCPSGTSFSGSPSWPSP